MWRVAFAFDPERKGYFVDRRRQEWTKPTDILIAGRLQPPTNDLMRTWSASRRARWESKGHAEGTEDVVASLPKGEQNILRFAGEASASSPRKCRFKNCARPSARRQTAVASGSGGPRRVSKLETRSDMRVSTLREFVEAMGGEWDWLRGFRTAPPCAWEHQRMSPHAKSARSTRHSGKPLTGLAVIWRIDAQTVPSFAGIVDFASTFCKPKQEFRPEFKSME